MVQLIRDAGESDAEAIAELLGSLGYPSTTAQVRARLGLCATGVDSRVFVAIVGETVVGVCSFHRIPTLHVDGYVGRITSLVVAPDHRGHGVGRGLTAALEKHAWGNGCSSIEVTSGDHRPEAHAFYERIGYRLDCRRFIKKRQSS